MHPHERLVRRHRRIVEAEEIRHAPRREPILDRRQPAGALGVVLAGVVAQAVRVADKGSSHHCIPVV